MSKHAGHILIITVTWLMVVMHAAPARSEEKSAAARIEAMANFLAKAPRIAVTADCTYDVVNDAGQKIEFGERRELRLRRPDRVRFDVVRRDGARRGLLFDGTQLTAFDLDAKAYATVRKPGTVDAALAHYTQDLKMRLPLRELFAADLPQNLNDARASASLVGVETVGDVATDHVAFRRDTADVQLWIARVGDPLPQRIVITYRRAEGQPQFVANFHAWDFKPDLPDSTFIHVPAAEAEQVPIQKRGGAAEEKRP